LVTYKYPRTTPLRGTEKTIVALIHCVSRHQIVFILPLFELA
jgi:hypothetical protein